MHPYHSLALGLATALLLTAGCTPAPKPASPIKPMERAQFDQQLHLESRKESNSSFHCSNKDFEDGVMFERTHSGDENGNTEVKCANFKQLDARLKYESEGATKTEFSQNNYPSGGFVCEGDKVVVGREHDGDENGKTRYYCRGLVGRWGETIKPSDRYWSEEKEEKNFDLTCGHWEVLTGFDHKHDENGKSRIQCAKLL